jgi:hypothetical protein
MSRYFREILSNMAAAGNSSEMTIELNPTSSPREYINLDEADGRVAGVGGASGFGPLGPGDDLEEMMRRLRLDAVLRTRLEERLIAERHKVADARSQGEDELFAKYSVL